ncbi:hypothetical protein C1645_806210 [Glomus cerebriforme]|uniref:Uncharacterized protein n=1 Tax=Glomus cerebriforme TaxID=658196 RepID=A0A397SU69_9GLOM|nr:hypothetical protein C1645_806210 [Glomus cerebriforme]
MPKANIDGKKKPWKSSELIETLNFLNDNFEMYYKNPYGACSEVIKATNSSRTLSSVYGKVHIMSKIMGHYIRTRKKITARNILWQDKKVRDLVRELCDKSSKRSKVVSKVNKVNEVSEVSEVSEETASESNDDSDDEITINDNKSTTTNNQLDVPSVEALNEIYKEQIKKVDLSKEKIETITKEVRDSFEQISQLRSEISQRQSELDELIERVNNLTATLRNFQ